MYRKNIYARSPNISEKKHKRKLSTFTWVVQFELEGELLGSNELLV